MVVGVLRLELLLYSPASLKEKRGLVQKVLARCRNRFPVSAAETGCHEFWQRTELGFVMVAGSEAQVRSVFDAIEAELEGAGEIEICQRFNELLHY